MKVTPIRQYERPSFPTRSIIDERPELLRLVPKRWQKNPVVIAALAATAALTTAGYTAAKERADLVGKTRINWVRLTEEEARQVICEEAKTHGIYFKPDVRTVTFTDPKPAPKHPTKTIRLRMDGTDVKHNVSYEYATSADLAAMGRQTRANHTQSEWSNYISDDTDSQHTERLLNAGLARAGPRGYYRAFVERPTCPDLIRDAKGKVDWKGTEKRGKVLAREQLHAQVRDFIKWLKAQGVI